MDTTYTDGGYAHDLFLEAMQASRLEVAEIAWELSHRPGIGRVSLEQVERWRRDEERVPADVLIAVRDLAEYPVMTVQEHIARSLLIAQIRSGIDRARNMISRHPGHAMGAVLATLGGAAALFRWKALTITGAALAASIVAGGFLATQPPSQPIVATSTPSASSTPIPATLITAPPLDPQARDEVPAPTPSPTASPVQGAMTATASPTPVPTVAPTPQPSAVPTPTPTPLPAAAPAPRCHPRLAALAKRAAVRARLLRGC